MKRDIHIICTRPIDESSLQMAATAGIHIRVVPFISTTTVQNEGMRRVLSLLSKQPITAVFTSRNAVAGIEQNLEAVPQWDVVCLEGKTLRAATQFFGQQAITATAPDAAQLAAAIINLNRENVVFFCGDRRLDQLPEALQTAGITVQEVIVYQTLETPVNLEQDYEGILFFSPSAVHSFFQLNTLPPGCTTFAIGATTAKTITPYTSNKLIISPANDEGTLIRQVINYYNEERLIT